MRHFVQRALYAPNAGYFAKQDAVSAAVPMEFSSMLGSLEFRQRVQELYTNSAQEWLTPSELFAPHWSHALAEYIIQAYQQLVDPGQASAAADSADIDGIPDADAEKLPPLHVYEIGAGTGTNALHFCTYLQQYYPHIYSCLKYTIIEISEPLAAKQLALLRSAGHGRAVRSVVADASQVALDERIANPDPCFVMMQEVLDNLPHDKLVRAGCVDAAGSPPPAKQGGGASQQLQLVQAAASMAAVAAEASGAASERWHQVTVAPASDSEAGGSWGVAMGLLGAPCSSTAGTELPQLPPLREDVAPLEDPWACCAVTLCIDTRPSVAQRAPLHPVGTRYGKPDPTPPTQLNEGHHAVLQAAANWLYPEAHPAAGDAAMGEDLAGASAAYAPTTALQLLSALNLALPRHHLIVADFAVLPASHSEAPVHPQGGRRVAPVSVAAPSPFDSPVQAFMPAIGEPLTASKPSKAASVRSGASNVRAPLSSTLPGGAKGVQGGGLYDHPTYLSPRPWGCADIYFSSDFCALQHAARYLRLAQEASLGDSSMEQLPAAKLPLSEAWMRSLQELHHITVKAGNAAGSAAQRSTVHTTAEFVGRYARQIAARTRTLTGYNPLLHGYSNTQFLIVDNNLLGVGGASS